MALEHIELSSAFDYGGLAVLRDAWERFAMVVGSRKLSNLCGSNTARVGEGRVEEGIKRSGEIIAAVGPPSEGTSRPTLDAQARDKRFPGRVLFTSYPPQPKAGRE